MLKMVVNSCDVNLVFYYTLENRYFHLTKEFINQNKNKVFLILDNLKRTYLRTFSEKLKHINDIVLSSLNKTNQELQNRNSKTNRPSSIELEEAIFKQKFKEMLSSSTEKLDDFMNEKIITYLFKTSLSYNSLKKINIQELWLENVQNSDIFSITAWHKFISNFSIKKDAPNFSYNRLNKWETQILNLKTKMGIFNDSDNEDIKLASEYLANVEDNSNIQFYSFDRDMINSLNKLKQQLKLNYPEAICLLPK